MSDRKTSWDDIPSIDGLEVDWEYSPDSALGRRTKMRLLKNDLKELLGKDHVGVKIAIVGGDYNASLMDISQIGIAVYLDERLEEETPVRFGLILGTTKIVAKAIVRNLNRYDQGFRVGLEFVDLNFDSQNYIGSLVSSLVYKKNVQ